MYQAHIHNRNYNEYSFSFNNEPIELNIQPFNEKLFDCDFFSIKEDKVEKIIESPIRKNILQGVLVLNGSKTYGSINNKLLYKCIPNNKKLPHFLIPYHHKISFQKTFTNIFINFRFENWSQKNPIGIITDVIGLVNDDKSFFEYEMYCRNIHFSINSFSKYCIQNIKDQKPFQKPFQYPFIFSIDPFGSPDFDDAFSVQEDKIFIYISNVPVFLEKINSNIWDLFSDRVSTIYLPSSKKPMLPSILSDNLCSLVNLTSRETIVMEIDIPSLSFSFFTTQSFISKNFVYEEKDLIDNIHYQLLLKNTRHLFSLLSDKYIEEINDSHDLVCYLMILMNHQIGLRLTKGIFRITEKNNNVNQHLIPNELRQFLNIWNSDYSGKYITNSEQLFHSQLNIYKYTHITSPIRRIVDIVNLILFQQQMEIFSFSEKALLFVEKWIHKINFINECTRQIKKTQNKCNLISLKEEFVEGYAFSKYNDSKCNDFYKYNVYIPKWKCNYTLSKYNDPKCNDPKYNDTTLNNVEMYKKYLFKIHVFEDEDKLNRRIRLSII
jgi:exoribonuclease R